MEFKFNTKDRKAVAGIHEGGHLLIQTDRGVVALSESGGHFHGGYNLDFWQGLITEKFYPGDEITIKF